jgi:hypothetical protein
MPSDFKQLTHALVGIQRKFFKTQLVSGTEVEVPTNELAYLSLTSKNEGIIRDAFCTEFYQKKMIFGREYKRIDAVSFSNAEVTDIFEFTSMFTADIVNENHFATYFVPKIINDFNKNNKYKENKPNEYIILVATHPKYKIAKTYAHYVKYLGIINKSLQNHPNPDQMIWLSYRNIRNHFPLKEYYVKFCKINAGREFNTEVDLLFWILSKKYCQCGDYLELEVLHTLTDDKYCSVCGRSVRINNY